MVISDEWMRPEDSSPELPDVLEGQTDVIKEILELVSAQAEIIADLRARVDRLSQDLHEIAPQKEFIDTMYEGEERLKVLDQYMNHA